MMHYRLPALVLGIFLALIPVAYGQESTIWVVWNESTDAGTTALTFVDTARVRETGTDRRSAWVATYYADDHPDHSSERLMMLVEVDCRQDLMRTLQGIVYGPDGRPRSSDYEVGDWRHVIPDSKGESLASFICGAELDRLRLGFFRVPSGTMDDTAGAFFRRD